MTNGQGADRPEVEAPDGLYRFPFTIGSDSPTNGVQLQVGVNVAFNSLSRSEFVLVRGIRGQ